MGGFTKVPFACSKACLRWKRPGAYSGFSRGGEGILYMTSLCPSDFLPPSPLEPFYPPEIIPDIAIFMPDFIYRII